MRSEIGLIPFSILTPINTGCSNKRSPPHKGYKILTTIILHLAARLHFLHLLAKTFSWPELFTAAHSHDIERVQYQDTGGDNTE